MIHETFYCLQLIKDFTLMNSLLKHPIQLKYYHDLPDLLSLVILVQAVYVGVDPKLGVASQSVTVRPKILIMRPLYWISLPGQGIRALTFYTAHHGTF